MSDTSAAPWAGWWQASDGRWYRPEAHPGYAPQRPPCEPTPNWPADQHWRAPTSPGPADTNTDSIRPPTTPHAQERWTAFRRCRWWQQALVWSALAVFTSLLLTAIAMGVLAGARDMARAQRLTATAIPRRSTTTTTRNPSTTTTRIPSTSTTRIPSTSTSAPATTSAPTTIVPEAERKGDKPNPGALYPNRPGGKKTDHEQVVSGTPVRFAGWSVWVLGTEFVDRPSQYDCCGFVRLHVRIVNRNQGEQTWYRDDFSIQTPAGEVYSPVTFLAIGSGNPLGISGGLVHGGVVEGDIWFHVGDRRGKCFLLWAPQSSPFNEDQGVWSITL